jgi:hypothetical protein
MKLFSAVAAIFLFSFGLWSEQITKKTLINYPAPLGTPVSTYFSVKVGGSSVFTHFLKVMDNTNYFPMPAESGHMEFPTTEAGMAYWSQSGTYTVEVKWLKGAVSSAKLFPASYGIIANISDSTVTFSVPVTSTPKQIVLIINNDEKHTLSLFANPLEVNPPSPGDLSIIYYTPGVHDVGKISLASNQTLYIAGGAIVNGYVVSNGKSNVKILGRGILNSDNYKGANWTYHNIYMSKCTNVQVDGIISMYSNCWTARFTLCNKVSLYNYKIAAAYRNYAGGIFPSGGSNYSINYCFTKTTDEEINPKGAPLDGVIIQNHVAYKDRGQGFIIGNHADGSGELKNITFKNCDIYFRSQDTRQETAMGVSKRQQSDIHNITFEDIRVEGNGANKILQLEIKQDSANYGNVNGGIHGVLFKDIKVTASSLPPSLFRGASRTGYEAWVSNVTIDNFLYNGSRKCDAAAANLIIDSHAEEPKFTIGASNISINF